MSHAILMDRPFERPAWKSVASWVAAILVAILFLSSGIWKISDPITWSVFLHQLKVPQNLSLPFTVILGISETLAGALILVPAYRKVGAWLAGLLLIAFMFYMGWNYSALHGADCSCFPFVKRVVDPAFFAEDALMLLAAIAAGAWASGVSALRGAYILAGAVVVFSLVSFGIASTRQSGTQAPEFLTVSGKPYSIASGKVFVYFYDPECMHCVDAGERMAKMNWGDTKFVGQPVVRPQFAPFFMQRTGLNGVTASNLDLLKKTFPFTSTPAAVAIQNGREVALLTKFDDPEPQATVRKLGFAR